MFALYSVALYKRSPTNNLHVCWFPIEMLEHDINGLTSVKQISVMQLHKAIIEQTHFSQTLTLSCVLQSRVRVNRRETRLAANHRGRAGPAFRNNFDENGQERTHSFHAHSSHNATHKNSCWPQIRRALGPGRVKYPAWSLFDFDTAVGSFFHDHLCGERSKGGGGLLTASQIIA